MAGVDLCPLCGRYVPEGRMVCGQCEIAPPRPKYIFRYSKDEIVSGLLLCANGDCRRCPHKDNYDNCNTLARDAAHLICELMGEKINEL